jgi:DNA mismatch repair protein MSH2
VGFVAFYKANMANKPATTVRFFNRGGAAGDHYTVHGEDAVMVARDYYKSMGVVKRYGSRENGLDGVSISKMMFQTIVRSLLLIKKYRVEIYAPGGGKKNGWIPERKGTPGNLLQFEDVLFDTVDQSGSSGVISINLNLSGGQKNVGVAFCDISLCEIQVCQFVDNDQFSSLEGLVVQLGAKECLLANATDGSDGKKLHNIAARTGLLVTVQKGTAFNVTNIKQDLGRLAAVREGVSAAMLPEFDQEHAMGAAASIISYLELLGNEDNFGQFKLSTYGFEEYMKLDAAAVGALNITPGPNDNGNKTMCVSGLLNDCFTAQGRRLMNQWVKQPLLDINRITERHDLVEALQNADLRESVEKVMKKMVDLHQVARKFVRGRADLKDIVAIYGAVERLPDFLETIREADCEHPEVVAQAILAPLEESIVDFEKYKQLVESTIDLEKGDGHEVYINAAYDETGQLQACHDKIEELEMQTQDFLSDAASDLRMNIGKDLTLEKDTKTGYYFRVTRKNDKQVRSNKQYQIVDTNKSGVKFTSSGLKGLNSNLLEQHAERDAQQSKIIAQIMGIAAGYIPVMEALGGHLAMIDVLAAFARKSADAVIPYVRPNMLPMGEGDLKLVNSRHPCVEVQDDANFIANDAMMVRGASEFCIITGPNMGGKSTYIRQIGVCVLMAQIGCFVPCDSADIPVIDRILARVGAGDSQLKGVSTFMAEMLETASIIRAATKNSLIIIDELGRGTSTYDGFGLAWAISEHICTKLSSFCVFATHFHELTALADQHASVTNLHVTAHTTKEALTFLYRVKEGICEQSFGINVAELANFPDTVVAHAKRKAAELENFTSADDGNGAGGGGGGSAMKTDEADAKRARQEEVAKAFIKAIPEGMQEATPEKLFATLRGIRQGLESKITAAGLA